MKFQNEPIIVGQHGGVGRVGTLRCDVPAGASRFFGQRNLATLPAGDGEARAGGRRSAPSLPPPVANGCVQVHHDGGQGTARPTGKK